MIPLPPLNQPWRRHAACGSLDPELFFLSDRMRGPEAQRHEDRAKAICATCPVTAECLAWAIEKGERFGVFGGTTPGERKRLVSTTWPCRPGARTCRGDRAGLVANPRPGVTGLPPTSIPRPGRHGERGWTSAT